MILSRDSDAGDLSPLCRLRAAVIKSARSRGSARMLTVANKGDTTLTAVAADLAPLTAALAMVAAPRTVVLTPEPSFPCALSFSLAFSSCASSRLCLRRYFRRNSSHFVCISLTLCFLRKYSVTEAPTDTPAPTLAMMPKTMAGIRVTPRVKGAAMARPAAVP